MTVLVFIWISILQLFCGSGILILLKIRLNPVMFLTLSIMTGLGVFSLVPFLMELMFIPLTRTYIFIALLLVSCGANWKFRKNILELKGVFTSLRFRVKLYEIPFLLVIGWIVLISAWRCYYYPPTPRDLTSGAEVIAEYATKEKTMINSVFSVNLETTNNPYKPAFITSLQIIYKYAGFMFGQVWLSILFACFIIFLYHALSITIHRLLAGLLVLCFLAVPEMYAYTFMVLFDYPNAVYFFLSTWFLVEFFKTGNRQQMVFAGLMMAMAVYIRSETLVLAGMMVIGIMWHHIRKWDSLTKLLISCSFYLLPAVLVYLVTVTVYLNFYLPVSYDVGALVNSNIFDLSPLVRRFVSMNGELIFSPQGVLYYGYFFFLFGLVFLFDLVFSDRLNSSSANWVYATLVIYFGYPILGFLLPLLDIDHSTKRGLFKIFPLMLLYIGTSSLLINLSQKITTWEESPWRLRSGIAPVANKPN